ncbi:uncharacterized protein LOC113234765 [Hyposmocoma kahamanoa]|uniref:uncharacterized protein LOC113234765 n=1 Tax=Hyposmocoma kahamanoa TaxID=1477025 RepID=UPI000E6D6739|nr:uncharacterized protein LOC113234765 [Hyposmocoma kahamanoa]
MRHDGDASALADRIEAFKGDPEKLRQATEFVDEIIQQAKKEAELKQKDKERSKFETQDPGVGMKRRLGRARGFVIRMFDALCNCTQTAAAAAARSTARNNPFTKR